MVAAGGRTEEEREGHRTCLQGMNRVFVHRGKAMYRTLLATCGSANNRCLYFIIGVFCWVVFFNEDELQNVVGPHVASNVRYIA